MSPNSNFWHWNKNLILIAKNLHSQDLFCQQQRTCLLTNQQGNQKFTLLYVLVIACRPGRYSTDKNHSSLWPQIIYTHFAHTTHFITYMLFFGLQTSPKNWRFMSSVMRQTLCRWVNSSWHFEDTTVLQNMVNYLRSDTNVLNLQKLCCKKLTSHRIRTLILLTPGLLTGYKMYPGLVFSSTVLSGTQ